MGDSTSPGPIGGGDAANRPAKSGLLGESESPNPIGSNPPIALQGPTPAAATSTQELNLLGSFPKPAKWTAAEELRLIKAKSWFPSTLDFNAVSGGSGIEIHDDWEFLFRIFKAKKPISRLNFFSHASASLFALQGELLEDGSNVLLATQPDTSWGLVTNAKIMDPYAKTWGDNGEKSGTVTITMGSDTFTLDQIRAKFAPDATMWLYLCHGAANLQLFQEIANTFKVTVKGFSRELVYCAPNNFPASRRHTVAVVTTPDPADSCGSGNVDFKALDTNANLRTAKPR